MSDSVKGMEDQAGQMDFATSVPLGAPIARDTGSHFARKI